MTNPTPEPVHPEEGPREPKCAICGEIEIEHEHAFIPMPVEVRDEGAALDRLVAEAAELAPQLEAFFGHTFGENTAIVRATKLLRAIEREASEDGSMRAYADGAGEIMRIERRRADTAEARVRELEAEREARSASPGVLPVAAAVEEARQAFMNSLGYALDGVEYQPAGSAGWFPSEAARVAWNDVVRAVAAAALVVHRCKECGGGLHSAGYPGDCNAPYHRPPISEQYGKCSRCGAHPFEEAEPAVVDVDGLQRAFDAARDGSRAPLSAPAVVDDKEHKDG